MMSFLIQVMSLSVASTHGSRSFRFTHVWFQKTIPLDYSPFMAEGFLMCWTEIMSTLPVSPSLDLLIFTFALALSHHSLPDF